MSKTLLLDVNVLLALAWPNHPFHQRARGRLARKPRDRWATCLLTQAAFVRLSSNPAIVSAAVSPGDAGELLQQMVAQPRHVFMEAKRSCLTQLVQLLDRCRGHNQVNDAFLIWLAQSHAAHLLTFDAHIQYLTQTSGVVEVIL